MRRTTIHRALAPAAVLLAAIAMSLAPLPALAQQHFDAVDTIPWTSLGGFPAYEAAPVVPTEFWVQAGALHDSNIFRLSKDANARAITGSDDRSDNILRLGAGVRHEQRIFGRQRVLLEARGEQYNYDRNSQLDHFAYGLRGEWLWEFTNDLSGTLGYERRKRLIDLAQVQTTVKDMITEQHSYATAAYQLGPTVRLRGGLDNTRGEHSDPLLDAAEVRINTVTGAVDYVTALGNALGVEARRSNGNAPVTQIVGGTPVDNEFTETEIALVGTAVAGTTLRGTARLGHTRRKHVEFPERNFTGTTGRLNVSWAPLQKTAFEFAAYREPRSIIDIAASYVVVTGVSFGPRWAPREKLVFSALLVHENQDFRGDPNQAVLGTPERQEVLRGIRLAAGWEPKRFIEVSAALEHGQRTSNVLLRDYDYNAVMANVRWRF